MKITLLSKKLMFLLASFTVLGSLDYLWAINSTSTVSFVFLSIACVLQFYICVEHASTLPDTSLVMDFRTAKQKEDSEIDKQDELLAMSRTSLLMQIQEGRMSAEVANNRMKEMMAFIYEKPPENLLESGKEDKVIEQLEERLYTSKKLEICQEQLNYG